MALFSCSLAKVYYEYGPDKIAENLKGQMNS